MEPPKDTSNESPSNSGRKGKQCAVKGCSNSFYESKTGQASGLHFFKFPITPVWRRTRWCSLIGRQHMRDGFEVTKYTVVCEKHFESEWVKRTPGSSRWTLREGAEPTLELPEKLSFSKTTPEPRRSPRKRTLDLSSSSGKKKAKRALESEASKSQVGNKTAARTMCLAAVQTELTIAHFMSDTEVVDTSSSELPGKLKDSNIKLIDISVVESLGHEIVKLSQSLHMANSQLQELKQQCEQYEKRQFTLESIKDDDQAILFYTGFQNYEALMNFGAFEDDVLIFASCNHQVVVELYKAERWQLSKISTPA